MKITCHGAAREVTGSCYCIETKRTRVLVDCGMFQGTAYADAKNFHDFGFDPSTVAAVGVTHAHLDHVGRLPKLVKDGFKGKIYATPPTRDIAEVVLENAEQLMGEAERREFRPKLYDEGDVKRAMKRFHAVDYSRWVKVGDIRFRFRDAGHIFGSSFIELEEIGGPRVIFSGDLGNRDAPYLRPTAQPADCDVLFIESTYGNRIHESLKERDKKLRDVIVSVAKRKGVLMVPAFAVERTQDLLYHLHQMEERGELPNKMNVYVDTPMGIKIIDIIKKYPQYYDREAYQKVVIGDDMFNFPGLHRTVTRDQSKAINAAPRPKMIIAGSGMMHGGRIVHHLVRYLSDPKSALLIVGYQARGTLGRRLYSGEKHVRVLNEDVRVKAKIVPIGAYSAHADQKKLLDWIREAAGLPEHVYCVHGEEESSAALASRITEELGIPADVPRVGQTINV